MERKYVLHLTLNQVKDALDYLGYFDNGEKSKAYKQLRKQYLKRMRKLTKDIDDDDV